MKLIAILRVKDEILHIEKCLSRLDELVDEVIVLDNGSTDGTLDVYPKFNKVVDILKTEGFNEGRDKIMLLEAAKKRKPDWIVWLDGDEVFEEALTRKILDGYMSSKYNKVLFRMCNFWLSEKLFRIDGKYFGYTLHPQRSMWRNIDEAYFKDKLIHNGDIRGVEKPHLVSIYRIKHYGYSVADKMKNKQSLYEKVDHENRSIYSHLTPEEKTIRLPYVSFRNKLVHGIFLRLNKLLIDLVQVAYRVLLKLKTVKIKS